MSDDSIYHSANYKRQFNTQTFYKNIASRVSVVLGRPLRQPEIHEVVSFIQKIDPELLAPAYQSKTIPIMVNTLATEFQKYDCSQPDEDDSQQFIRDTIGLSSESGTAHGIYDDPSFFTRTENTLSRVETALSETFSGSSNKLTNLLGMNTASEAVRVLNPTAVHRKNYMLLDSRYRILSGSDVSGISQFSWNYILNSQADTQGSVNIIGNVRDIIAMRVYPFRIPYVDTADNNYARISVFVEELGSQAFVAHEDRKFHFMLRATNDTEFIELETNKFNDGYFYFEKPITTLNTLTVSFGSPLEPIIFPIDRSWCGIDYFSDAPATRIYTYPSSSLSATATDYVLANGDRVYFSMFDVGDIDALLVEQTIINTGIKDGINRSSGFEISNVSSTTFTIDFDSSNIQNPITDIRFKVYFGSKRIFMPVELTYIMPDTSKQ
jgi:hypothetical protein